MDKKIIRTGKIIEVLTKEYKYENLFLLIVAVIALTFGIMIVAGDLTIVQTVPILGEFPIIFAWVLIAISTIGLLVVAFPFYQPSFGEINKITWATSKEFLVDFVRVFAFIIFVSFTFIFYDIVLKELYGLIYG